jgi:hypothetical protein
VYPGDQGIHAQNQITIVRRRDNGRIIPDAEDDISTAWRHLRAFEIAPDEFEFRQGHGG